MTPVTEIDVAQAAYWMGYHLLKGPEGYALLRENSTDKEILEAESLEAIADFLKH
jgi:hypothetical protein